MTFWHTKKSEGDDIELEQVTLPQKAKFGENTAIPTPHQKKMWKKLSDESHKKLVEGMENVHG